LVVYRVTFQLSRLPAFAEHLLQIAKLLVKELSGNSLDGVSTAGAGVYDFRS